MLRPLYTGRTGIRFWKAHKQHPAQQDVVSTSQGRTAGGPGAAALVPARSMLGAGAATAAIGAGQLLFPPPLAEPPPPGPPPGPPLPLPTAPEPLTPLPSPTPEPQPLVAALAPADGSAAVLSDVSIASVASATASASASASGGAFASCRLAAALSPPPPPPLPPPPLMRLPLQRPDAEGSPGGVGAAHPPGPPPAEEGALEGRGGRVRLRNPLRRPLFGLSACSAVASDTCTHSA